VSDSDCLHYCSGSVQDHWALLLLNALQVRISSALPSPTLPCCTSCPTHLTQSPRGGRVVYTYM